MKSLAPYFGNRFATVAAKTKKSARKVKPAVSEMEALESRILLSGIVADGTKSYKKLTYTDLEGDKVTISVSQGSFTIVGTNGDSNNELLTVDKITLSDLTAKSSLSIKVANVNPNKNGDAFTNIGEITAAASTKAIKSVTLDGANVANLNIADTTVGSTTKGINSGGIFLKASAANILDRINVAGTNNGSLAQVNFNNISAESVSVIQAATQGYGVGTGLNFNGSITVDSGTTTINGLTSTVNGLINLEDAKNINVAAYAAGSQITTENDLVLALNNGQSVNGATFTVGKNLHLSALTGGLDNVTFNVTGSISGSDSASTTDVVAINGAVGQNAGAVTFNTDSSFAGITVKGGDATFALGTVSATNVSSIGAVTVTQGSLTAGLTASGNIGAISARDEIVGSINSLTGSVGAISATYVDGNVEAETTIGNINLSGQKTTAGGIGIGAAIGTIKAGTAAGAAAQTGGDIGTITAKGDVGAVFAYNGAVGNIQITNGSLASVQAGSANATFAGSGGNIGSIQITGSSTSAETLGSVTAFKGNIGQITITDGYLNGSVVSGSDAGSFTLIGGNITGIQVNNSVASSQALTGGNNITAKNGTIGAITLNTSGSLSNSIDLTGGNVTISSVTSVGAISIAATGAGGVGIESAAQTVSVKAPTITSVSVTGTESTSTADDAVSIGAAATLTIGDTTATTGTGVIGNVSIVGDLAGTLNLQGRANGGGVYGTSVGTISVTTDNDATASTWTVNGLNLNTITGLTQLGDSDDTLALVTTDNLINLITISAVNAVGGVDLTGLPSAELTSLGATSIGGALTLDAAASELSAVTSMGSFNVGSLAGLTNAANLQIGAGAGATTGLITIGKDASATAFPRYYHFNFATWAATGTGTVATISANSAGVVTAGLYPDVITFNEADAIAGQTSAQGGILFLDV